MKIVVGLGNYKREYQKTRHNIGQIVVERLAEELASGQWSVVKKLQSVIYRTPQAILVKPLTFMNESGRAVKRLIKHFKVEPASLWVVHDDIDLSLGKIKVQKGRGAGGHHGVESVIEEIGTKDFWRVRLGIGRPKKIPNALIEEFVLSEFGEEEKPVVEEMIKRAVERLRRQIL